MPFRPKCLVASVLWLSLVACDARTSSGDPLSDGAPGVVDPAAPAAQPGPGSPGEATPGGAATPVGGARAERIVTLVPSAAELIFALGEGDAVVARSLHTDYPPEVVALPSIGSGLDPDVEQIIALRPSLIVASSMQDELPALRTLRDAGVEVITLPGDSIADIDAALGILGARLSAQAAAARVRDAMHAELSAARREAPETPQRVLVAVGTDPVYAAGSATFIDTLVRNAGGENVVEGEWVRLDDETLIALAPDVIMQPADSASELANWSSFGDALPATRTGALCAIDRNALARPGPRVGLAASQIRDCLVRHASP